MSFKHYMNDPTTDYQVDVANDMRDTRPWWRRFVMLFSGWCAF